MASKKTKDIKVRATTKAAINTDKCIILSSTRNELTDDVQKGDPVNSEEKDDQEDGKDIDVFDKTTEYTNQKGKKKRKKRKNKKTKTVEKPKEETVNVRRNNVKLEPILKQDPTEDNRQPTPLKVHSGCLGFITSWLAKRKEKRREKKRQAIRARFSHSLNNKLKEYEHKRARGGVAFNVELDNRPLKKPLLPPIQTKSRPINFGCEEKLQKAEKKRQEQLMKRKEYVRAQEEKRKENAERKADNERGFKQKAALTIIAKQGQAKRNQSRMESEKRCPSSLRRATSVMSRATSGDDDSFDDTFFD